MMKLNFIFIFCLTFNAAVFSQHEVMRVDSLSFLQIQRKVDSLLKADAAGRDMTVQEKPQQVRTSPSSNPDISVIGDFQGSYKDLGKRNFDAGLNEAELAFQSEVDPYARADFHASFGKDASGNFSVGIEEAYVSTLSLPAGLQLRAGKFRSALGRINPVHPHSLPFISLPNAYENYFGEGINDEGVSLSWLVPNRLFYQELVVQGTNGPLDCPSFSRSSGNKYLGLAHLKNFWDLSGNATLEFGLSGITGPNDSDLTSTVGAADLTFKWKPLRMNTYRSFTWQSEVYFSNRSTMKDSSVKSIGMYTMMSFQFSKRWFFTGIYSCSNRPYSADIKEQAYSATVGWNASEFQKIEIEGKTITSNTDRQTYQAWLRWIFMIGSHEAHPY